MTNQPQPSTDHSLRDRLIFTRHLEFTVDLTPEACFERLIELTTEKEGILNPSSITTQPVTPTEHRYEYRVSADRYGQFWGAEDRSSHAMRYSMAQFAGVIDVTPTGKTKVSGDLSASGLVLLMLVGLVILFLITLGVNQIWVFSVIIVLIAVFYALQLRADYRKLRKLIEGTFQSN